VDGRALAGTLGQVEVAVLPHDRIGVAAVPSQLLYPPLPSAVVAGGVGLMEEVAQE